MMYFIYPDVLLFGLCIAWYMRISIGDSGQYMRICRAIDLNYLDTDGVYKC